MSGVGIPYVPGSATSKAAAYSMLPIAGTMRARVFDVIKAGVDGATDEEIEIALGGKHQSVSARRRELVLGGHIVDSGRTRINKSGRDSTVWIEPRAGAKMITTDAKPCVKCGALMVQPWCVVCEQPPSSTEFSRAGLGEGPPPDPLPASSIGYARALAAVACSVLTHRAYRVTWEVDADREITLTKKDLPDHSNPSDETEWGRYLFRFRNALDRQAWGKFRARCAMAVILTTPNYGRCRALYAIPWRIDLTRFGKPPPVGHWKIEPQAKLDRSGVRAEDEYEPAAWWLSGLPF